MAGTSGGTTPEPTAPAPSTYMSKPAEKAAAPAAAAPKTAARETPAAPEPAPKPATPASSGAASGTWRVQLGAFSQEGRAETLWKTVSGKVNGLSGHEHYLVKSGRLTLLQAGPLASKSEAGKLCGQIKAAGTECIVKLR